MIINELCNNYVALNKYFAGELMLTWNVISEQHQSSLLCIDVVYFDYILLHRMYSLSRWNLQNSVKSVTWRNDSHPSINPLQDPVLSINLWVSRLSISLWDQPLMIFWAMHLLSRITSLSHLSILWTPVSYSRCYKVFEIKSKLCAPKRWEINRNQEKNTLSRPRGHDWFYRGCGT